MEYYTDDHNRCPKCGLPFWDDHKSTAVPNLCKCRADNHKWGWECPRCGRVNAPWMPYCNCQITQYKIYFHYQDENGIIYRNCYGQ